MPIDQHSISYLLRWDRRTPLRPAHRSTAAGYPVGTVPPVGLKTPMPAFMDPAIQSQEVVYAGGGGIDALLRIQRLIPAWFFRLRSAISAVVITTLVLVALKA